MKRFLVFFLAAALPFAVSPATGAAGEETTYKTYRDARFGYSVEYPDIFGAPRETDDGAEFEGADGEYTLSVRGGKSVPGSDGEALLNRCKERVAHIVPDSEKSGPGFYSIEYSDDGGQDGVEHIFHEYGAVDAETEAGFVLKYPKEEEERFAVIKSAMEASLKLPASVPPYSVKNGRVYRKGAELDAEVHEAPEGLDNGIQCWAAIENEDAPEDTGVWFFTRDEGDGGQAIGFIPLDSAGEYQDLLWSPDGGQLLLVTGSGMRPDVLFALYADGMEKKSEISGMLGGAAWIDPVRFVLTRIDDLRADEDGAILRYAGFRTSVVLYDTAARAKEEEETLLKEGSDTQSYAFGKIAEDGEKIVIEESYVDSPKDWSDEDKIKTREITVEIPAAG